MKNEAEEVQGAVQVNCLSEIPQQQHNTAAKCPDLQHLQFPWYKYSHQATNMKLGAQELVPANCSTPLIQM